MSMSMTIRGIRKYSEGSSVFSTFLIEASAQPRFQSQSGRKLPVLPILGNCTQENQSRKVPHDEDVSAVPKPPSQTIVR